MSELAIDCIADTSVVIGLSRRDATIISAVGEKNFAISFITVAELRLGILKAAKQMAAWERIEEVTAGTAIIYASRDTATFYASICHDLERRGARIPSNDMWIAAAARENALPLLARDEHFARVSGLNFVPC